MPMNNDAYRQMLTPGYAPQGPQSNAPAGMNPMQPMQTPMQPSGIGDYSELPPEVLAALLGNYGDVIENEALGEQLAQAQALRDTPMPEGRQGGRVYTAANPLEFIGAGIRQYSGAQQAKEIEEERKRLRTEIGKRVAGYGLNQPR